MSTSSVPIATAQAVPKMPDPDRRLDGAFRRIDAVGHGTPPDVAGLPVDRTPGTAVAWR